MNRRQSVRALFLLIAAAVFVVGYILFRGQSGRTDKTVSLGAYGGLKFSENIYATVSVRQWGAANAGLPKSKSSGPLQTDKSCQEMARRLEKEIGRELRSGGVRFVPTAPLQEDGYPSVPSGEEGKVGHVSLEANLFPVEGAYIACLRLTAEPGGSYESFYRLSVTSDAEVVSQLQTAVRELAAQTIISLYRIENRISDTPYTATQAAESLRVRFAATSLPSYSGGGGSAPKQKVPAAKVH